MAANLTPQYSKAEDEYRRAQTPAERVVALERMLQLIPKHKGTERLQADLKTRLKETRDELQKEKSAPRSHRTDRIPRQGAGTVMILGAPNSGKSLLLKTLTKAQPEVAPYPFTTREALPGMMDWQDVRVQLVDTPPITASQLPPGLVSQVRSADAVLLAFDGSSDDAPQETAELLQALESRKTRLTSRTGFDDEDLSIVEVNTLLAVTHCSDADWQLRVDMLREMTGQSLQSIPVELVSGEGTDALREAVFKSLGVIRLYTRRPGQPAERVDPFTLPEGSTVEDLAGRVHKDLAATVKHAKVWALNSSECQTVGKDHPLREGDLVELHG